MLWKTPSVSVSSKKAIIWKKTMNWIYPAPGHWVEDYYQLIAQHEKRKQDRKEREQQLDMERAKEEEVRAAYMSLNEDEKASKITPSRSLARQTFNLFCYDHVKHFYLQHDMFYYATKRVEFYHLDYSDCLLPDGEKSGLKDDMLYGTLYLDCRACCDFGSLCPPEHASRKAIKMKSNFGKYELLFRFIGNGYLTLTVSRELVFMYPHPAAPQVFEFIGIWRHIQKERAANATRETFFEMSTWR
jgi:hypothetical protein